MNSSSQRTKFPQHELFFSQLMYFEIIYSVGMSKLIVYVSWQQSEFSTPQKAVSLGAHIIVFQHDRITQKCN